MDSQKINGCEACLGRGCKFCPSEIEGEMTAEMAEGCFNLHATDWLADYPDNIPTDIVEVRFKNTHRGYFANVNNLTLNEGDIVAVEATPGHDIGVVSLTGDMVARQMRRVGFAPANGEFKKIYRKARNTDIDKWRESIAREHEIMIRSRQIAAEMQLNMKIGDVEAQGDGTKAIFYYIADERVDFRELIKVFAEHFHCRIEMKQIGARQEAGRIGGLGACGRRLCCASWISSFNSVTTNAARTQDLSLNPQKLAGQCSKLKCCLVYELDDYLDARREFPRVNEPLRTLDADYFHVKNDILARTMSFSTAPNSLVGLVTLSIERVREIMKMNAEGKKPEKINSEKVYDAAAEEPTFVNMVGEDSITRFDRAKNNKKKKKNRNNNNNPNRQGGQQGEQGEQSNGQSGQNAGQQGGQNRQNNPNRDNRNRPDNQRRNNNQGGQNRQEGQQGGNQNRGEGNRNRNNQNRNRQNNPNRGGQNNGQNGGNGGRNNNPNRANRPDAGEASQPQSQPQSQSSDNKE